HSPISLEDDRDGVAGPLGELLVQQVQGGLGLRTRGVEVGAVVTGGDAPEDRHADEGDDPDGDDPSPVPETTTGEPLEHGPSLSRWTGALTACTRAETLSTCCRRFAALLRAGRHRLGARTSPRS